MQVKISEHRGMGFELPLRQLCDQRPKLSTFESRQYDGDLVVQPTDQNHFYGSRTRTFRGTHLSRLCSRYGRHLVASRSSTSPTRRRRF